MFIVTDSGIGLTAAEIKRLFRPFAQASEQVARNYGGAGLGLTFVKRIAKAMGGDLAVASEPGSGSRFRLSVTVDKVEAAATAPSEGAAARDAAARSLAVLCVEDNPYGRVLLNTLLAELGHRADFVGTGAAAVEAVAQGRYDVVALAYRSSACPPAPMPPTRPPAVPQGWTATSPSRSARARSRRCSHPWRCKQRNDVATAASVADPDRSPTPSIVDAGFHDVKLLLNAGVEEKRACGIRESEVAGVEAHVIVFDLR